MVEIERRDKLAQPQDEHDGECFIAYRCGDKVHTLSGIAVQFEIEHYTTSIRGWDVIDLSIFNPEHTVTIRFLGNLVEEVRPFGGED